eukprot:320076-Prorocentrum_minimum.AAC.1
MRRSHQNHFEQTLPPSMSADATVLVTWLDYRWPYGPARLQPLLITLFARIPLFGSHAHSFFRKAEDTFWQDKAVLPDCMGSAARVQLYSVAIGVLFGPHKHAGNFAARRPLKVTMSGCALLKGDTCATNFQCFCGCWSFHCEFCLTEDPGHLRAHAV